MIGKPSKEQKKSQMLAKDYANSYDSEHKNAFFTAVEATTVKKWTSLYLKGFMLDFGCGTGIYNHLLCPQFLVGIDINFEMLKQYKEKFPEKSVIQCDSENLPFKSSVFDCVLSSGTLHHLNNPPKAMKEIYRVLKNSGYLCSKEMQKSEANGFLEFVYLLFFGKPKKTPKKIKNEYFHHPGHEGKKYIPTIFIEAKKFGFELLDLYCLNHQWLPFRRFWNNTIFVWKILFMGSKFFDKIPTVRHKGSISVAILKKSFKEKKK